MSDECFEIEIQDEIAHIRFARPERFNSMTLDFWNRLPEVIDDIDSKGKARVIVISSTGKHFTAGMDLSVFESNKLTFEDNTSVALLMYFLLVVISCVCLLTFS